MGPRSFDVKRTDDLLANRVVFELSAINYTNNYYKLTKCLVQLIRINDNVIRLYFYCGVTDCYLPPDDDYDVINTFPPLCGTRPTR